MEGSTNIENQSKGDGPPNLAAESATNTTEVSSSKGDQRSNDAR